MNSRWYEIPQISECFWEVLWLYGTRIIEDIHTRVWVGYPAGMRMSEAGSEGRNRLGEAGLEAWEKVLSFPELISWNSLPRSSKRNHGNKLAKCPLLKPGNLFSFQRWETCRVYKCVLDVSRAQQQWAQAISQAWVREQRGFWRILRLIRAKGIIGAPPWQLASNSQSANTDVPPGFPFASFLYNLFLSWSNRLLHHCGLGLSLNIIFTLAHSLLQLQTPEPGQQTQQEFVLRGARFLQHQEDLQLLRDIMWQLWFLWASAQESLSACILSVWGCCVTQRALTPRLMQGHVASALCLYWSLKTKARPAHWNRHFMFPYWWMSRL